MKKLSFMFTIMLALFVAVSCSSTTETNDDDKTNSASKDSLAEKTDEKETPKVEAEKFEVFYKKFVADKEFQLSRVNFPIKGQYVEEDVNQKWTKENWVHLKEIETIDTVEFKVTVEEKPEEVYHSIILPNSGFSINYRFNLVDGKWFIVEKNESNF